MWADDLSDMRGNIVPDDVRFMPELTSHQRRFPLSYNENVRRRLIFLCGNAAGSWCADGTVRSIPTWWLLEGKLISVAHLLETASRFRHLSLFQ